MKDEAQAHPVFDQLLVRNELHSSSPGEARWRIIFGGVMARQRALAILLALLAGLGAGCEARSSVEAAQTAIVAVQTVVPAAQAEATQVSNALANAQPLVAILQGLLQGAAVQVTTKPEGAQPSAVTSVTIEATDSQGTLAQVDAGLRQAAAQAALSSAAQYYPNATITLTLLEASGAPLVSGSVAPGQSPRVQ
jgi:hypothetical protein